MKKPAQIVVRLTFKQDAFLKTVSAREQMTIGELTRSIIDQWIKNHLRREARKKAR